MIQRCLDPKNDVAFKRVFGTKKNQDILICLLNQVFLKQIVAPIINVSFINSVQELGIVHIKNNVVEVLCEDECNNYYIVQMQLARFKGAQEKFWYYAAKTFVNHMKPGGRYEGVKKMMFLTFTDFVLFPNCNSYKSTHVILDRKTLEHNFNRVSFTFVDLMMFNDSLSTKLLSSLNLEEKFYYFLKCLPLYNASELDLVILSDDILKKAYYELDFNNWSKDDLFRYEQDGKVHINNEVIHNYALKLARDEGFQEGIKEGIEQGFAKGMEQGIEQGIDEGRKQASVMMAINMLNDGLDINCVKKITSLSDKELKYLA